MRSPTLLPSDLSEAPFPDCIAAATLLQALADLRDPREADDVRRAIADGSISFWLSLLQLEEGTEQRVAAHLQELAQTPPTPVPHDLPDPAPPLRVPGRPGVNPDALNWVRQRRQDGWSQRKLAAVLGCSQPTLSLLLRAERQSDAYDR